MHTIAEIGSSVPAFLGKLWKMVEDPVTNDLITWSSSGNSFLIKDEIRFARELLPMYYKHNNMASFIRQLNMYGFHKIVSPESGSMKMEVVEQIQFTHPCFIQGHPYLLENIKRKIGASKLGMDGSGDKSPPVFSKVLSDIRHMKGRQESMDGRLSAMKLENAALWRELSVLRQKHIKQQQIVNKLIQFLVSVVHQNQNSFSVKRKVFPRMLQHHHGTGKHQLDVKDCATTSATSPGGPVIHELDPTEALLEDVVEEAESITPIAEETSDPNYFLNQPNVDEEGEVDDVSTQPLVLNVNNDATDDETIIGVPEDTLIINLNNQLKQNHNQYVLDNSSASIRIPSVFVKSEERAKPKMFKIIPKKSKQKEEKWILQPRQIVLQRPTPKQTVSTQPQFLNKDKVNKNQLKRRKTAKKSQLNKVNLNLQNKLAGIGNQKTVESQNQEINTTPIDSNSFLPTDQRLVETLNGNSLLNTDNCIVISQPQQPVDSSVQKEQGSISVQNTQPLTPTPVITIPYDSGACETILSDVATSSAMDSINLPIDSEEFSLPNGVESILPTSSPIVASPDPVMTPCVTEPSPPFFPPSDSTTSPSCSQDLQLACVDDSQVPLSPNLVSRSGLMLEEMDSHLGSVQSDLDTLKELLRSEGISLDANALLGCFNEDPLSYNIMSNSKNEQDQLLKENSGNELMTYNPSLFDLTDLMGNDWDLPSPGAEQPADDMFADINTPQFVPQSPTFPTPSAKKRKK